MHTHVGEAGCDRLLVSWTQKHTKIHSWWWWWWWMWWWVSGRARGGGGTTQQRAWTQTGHKQYVHSSHVKARSTPWRSGSELYGWMGTHIRCTRPIRPFEGASASVVSVVSMPGTCNLVGSPSHGPDVQRKRLMRGSKRTTGPQYRQSNIHSTPAQA